MASLPSTSSLLHPNRAPLSTTTSTASSATSVNIGSPPTSTRSLAGSSSPMVIPSPSNIQDRRSSIGTNTPPLQPLTLFTPTLPQTPPPFSSRLSRPDDHLMPLDDPRASPPPTPTPSSSAPTSAVNPALMLLNSSRIRAISPPTPAPSPQPFAHGHGGRFPSNDWSSDAGAVASSSSSPNTHVLTEEELVDQMHTQFFGLSSRMRQRLLMSLIEESSPSALSPLLPLITPRLKRDFLKTLPLELAYHVLSFVDDVRTLARASGVSRFWRALLEDEGTWKRMCWKSGFGEADSQGNGVGSVAPTPGQRLRRLEFGEREEEEGTPAGRERRGTVDRTTLAEFAARAEHFGLRQPARAGSGPGQDRLPTWQPLDSDATLAEATAPSGASSGGSAVPEEETAGLGFGASFSRLTTGSIDSMRFNPLTQLRHPSSSMPATPHPPSFADDFDVSPTQVQPPYMPSTSLPSSSTHTPTKPFSYKTHFKRAYLTESAWLRGPGRLLSTQMSADDGVVTSLGFDSDWIVVGMATSKVHVFEAATGTYYNTLDGHELGVWCLTLVSKGGGPLPDPAAGHGRKNSNVWEIPRTPPPKARAPTFHSDDRRRAPHDHSFTNDSPMTGNFFRHPRDGETQEFPSSRPRRRSFHAFTSESAPSESGPSRSNSSNHRGGGMGLGAGGETGDSSQQAGVCGTARGWGQPGAIVVTGGCDRDVRVWDVETAECLHVLRGHTSTVRCMRVLDGRPIAVSGSRDNTLRVWNIQTGQPMHLLSGHEHSVRCIEVSGNKVVSGSYDATCRLWDVDTGECLFVFRGHIHQIYAVAFDGVRVVTGSLDSTVRIWSAITGQFIMILQGHTSLVGQLQLDPVSNTLITGGSDGRVIVFDMENYQTIHRLCAHDNSVTCLQFDDRFIVTAGNDGRIKLWDFKTGFEIRELAEPCDAVWRVTFRDDKAVILCRRDGRTLMDVKTFRPSEAELHGEMDN